MPHYVRIYDNYNDFKVLLDGNDNFIIANKNNICNFNHNINDDIFLVMSEWIHHPIDTAEISIHAEKFFISILPNVDEYDYRLKVICNDCINKIVTLNDSPYKYIDLIDLCGSCFKKCYNHLRLVVEFTNKITGDVCYTVTK